METPPDDTRGSLPFEFTVEGPPVSYQARPRSRVRTWSAVVREAAAKRWLAASPLTEALRIAVTYYHEGPAIRIDNDNLLKPIQDALNGLVYEDDRQITDVICRKTDINGPFRVRGESLVLLEAFSRGRPFLHIRIDAAPNHTLLLR